MSHSVKNNSRGCIVLRSRTATPNSLALETAVRLAKALRFQIKSVFLEDQDVLAFADLPFAEEITSTGSRTSVSDFAEMEKRMQRAARVVQRLLDRLARDSAVTCDFQTVRGSASTTLAKHCNQSCFAVMADTFDATDLLALRNVFEETEGLAGALLVGPHARRRTGPIVIVADDVVLPQQVLKVSAYLASEHHMDEVVVLVTDERLDDDAIYQSLSSAAVNLTLKIIRPENGGNEVRTIVHATDQCDAGIVIAVAGQTLRLGNRELRSLTNALGAPLLLLF